MTETTRNNGQIPTDPTAALLIFLIVIYAAGQLTADQIAAIDATRSVAELALLVLLNVRGGR